MSFCLFSEAPPLSCNGNGNHGVANYLCQILCDDLALVITEKYRRKIRREDIIRACGNKPFLLYPDVSSLGVRRFFPKIASFGDLFLFILWMPRISAGLKAHEVNRLFVLCGADAWVLFKVWLLQLLGIPTEIYLVDDMETAALHGKGYLPPVLIKPLLRSVLNRCSKIHAISEGFAEHLSSRFGCPVSWLPLPSIHPPPAVSDEIQEDPQRFLVYIGALNHLYVDAIREVYEEICLLNESEKSEKKLYLKIMSYSDPALFIDSLPNTQWVVSYRNLSDDEMRRHLSQATACLLPYSFAEEEKLMVSTSFSCKILEYYGSGRPILVYGPSYASIPRFFEKEQIPHCATEKSKLRSLLQEMDHYDSSKIKLRYREVWEKYHSPRAIRERLF